MLSNQKLSINHCSQFSIGTSKQMIGFVLSSTVKKSMQAKYSPQSANQRIKLSYVTNWSIFSTLIDQCPQLKRHQKCFQELFRKASMSLRVGKEETRVGYCISHHTCLKCNKTILSTTKIQVGKWQKSLDEKVLMFCSFFSKSAQGWNR